MWFKILQISLLVIFTYSAFGNTDENCEFSSHATSALDATDRSANHPCTDGIVSASLTSCEPMVNTQPQRPEKRKSGDR